MTIKPFAPFAIYGDMERAREIARSWGPLNHLSAADAEIVAKAIAEGIARGRRHGLEMGQACHDARRLA